MAQAIVIGSGPNGLVAANVLADAGVDVLVLEAAGTLGGAVSSDRGVHPDFVHDRFSAFHPLAAASPVMTALDLGSHGLEWTRAPAVLGHVTRREGWHLQFADPERTARAWDARSPGDGRQWWRAWQAWERWGPDLLDVLLSPWPPTSAIGPMARSVSGARFLGARALPVDWLNRRFSGADAPLLLSGNAAHSDMSSRLPGSGMMAFVLTMLGHQVGFPAARGGAQQVTDALVRRLRAAGGQVHADSRVVRLVPDGGRGHLVRLADGTVLSADVVVAAVSAPMLFEQLLDPAHLGRLVRAGAARFVWDPATVKVDWALAGPVPWRETPEVMPGTVHLADSPAQIAAGTRLVTRGIAPAHPFVVAGQMTTTDPSRSPAGTESLWAYTRVPQRLRADAGGVLTGRWDHSDLDHLADRVESRFEEVAPGFRSQILARRVLGPHELEGLDASLVGGAIGGGTQRLRQQLVLRPVPGRAGAGTSVPGVFLGSASAHPGGGVHGAPGHTAAVAALRHLQVGHRKKM